VYLKLISYLGTLYDIISPIFSKVNRQSSEYSPDNIFHLPIFFNREDPQFDDDSVTDDSVFVLSLPMSHTVGRVYTPRRTLRVNPLIQNVASLQMN
jgi:hypothetical protein